MTALDRFHLLVDEMLATLGIAPPPLDNSNGLLRLHRQGNVDLLLGLGGEDFWYLLIDLGQPPPELRYREWHEIARRNAISDEPLQPVLALDRHDNTYLWIKLPLVGCTTTMSLAAFHALIGCGHEILYSRHTA